MDYKAGDLLKRDMTCGCVKLTLLGWLLCVLRLKLKAVTLSH